MGRGPDIRSPWEAQLMASSKYCCSGTRSPALFIMACCNCGWRCRGGLVVAGVRVSSLLSQDEQGGRDRLKMVVRSVSGHREVFPIDERLVKIFCRRPEGRCQLTVTIPPSFGILALCGPRCAACRPSFPADTIANANRSFHSGLHSAKGRARGDDCRTEQWQYFPMLMQETKARRVPFVPVFLAKNRHCALRDGLAASLVIGWAIPPHYQPRTLLTSRVLHLSRRMRSTV